MPKLGWGTAPGSVVLAVMEKFAPAVAVPEYLSVNGSCAVAPGAVVAEEPPAMTPRSRVERVTLVGIVATDGESKHVVVGTGPPPKSHESEKMSVVVAPQTTGRVVSAGGSAIRIPETVR